jgi:hypothetical protein
MHITRSEAKCCGPRTWATELSKNIGNTSGIVRLVGGLRTEQVDVVRPERKIQEFIGEIQVFFAQARQ